MTLMIIDRQWSILYRNMNSIATKFDDHDADADVRC